MSGKTPAVARQDPINEKYFKPVERVDRASDYLFYGSALLSFAILIVDKKLGQNLFDGAQMLLVLMVVLLFVLGLASRLLWTPNALDARRKDWLSNAYGVPLTHEQTTGYYNNDESDPLRRLGVATLENAFFSRAVATRMSHTERIRSGIYLALFLCLAMYRRADLSIAATAAQVVFSEQIISRWARLEWYRSRSERAYQGLYSIFQATPKKRVELHAQVLDWAFYNESSKSGSGVTLSNDLFNKLNPSLTTEWNLIKATLGL